jgi:hypothetical protein
MFETEKIIPDFCSYVSSIEDFLNFHNDQEKERKISEIFGKLYNGRPDLNPNSEQGKAWSQEIADLMDALTQSKAKGWIIFEYSIYRLSDRIDVVLLMDSIVYSLEFKAGHQDVTEASIDQAARYAYDLKNFHQASKSLWVCPILVVQNQFSLDKGKQVISHSENGLFDLQASSQKGLGQAIANIAEANPLPSVVEFKPMDCVGWIKSQTTPAPDILRATQFLYDQVSSNTKEFQKRFKCDPAHPNIVGTTDTVETIIETTKLDPKNKKAIIFVAGVPGAGKTVVGLNVAFKHANPSDKAVFVSGNGPLVEVLQATLRHAIKDDYEAKVAKETDAAKIKILKAEQKEKLGNRRGIAWMIEQFTSYKSSLQNGGHADEHIIVFDEAQRAWTQEQMQQYAAKKARKEADVSHHPDRVVMIPKVDSEPVTLLKEIYANNDWNVILCLVGLGQDIHNGEEGINEWLRSCLSDNYPGLQVYMGSDLISQTIDPIEPSIRERLLTSPNVHCDQRWDSLYLKKSLRNVTGDTLHEFTEAVLSGDKVKAKANATALEDAGYEICLTRDFRKAKLWLYNHRAAGGRWGVIASSHADKLKEDGIVTDERFTDMDKWFFAPSSDQESSNGMQKAISEFSIEGLEVDRACVGWDLDFYWDGVQWVPQTFAPTTGWRNPKDAELARYIRNSYRVLLTRSRFGFVIYVPDTSLMVDPITGKDLDSNRSHDKYNAIAQFFEDCGITNIKDC